MDYEQQRHWMVESQVAGRGVRDSLVLEAMRKVERHRFVPPDLCHLAYHDGALPIGCGQTISQPYMVAMMTEALQLNGGETVLEIGTGSGYAAAVLAEIAENVITIERVAKLAEAARQLLKDLAYPNITVITGDGTKGCPESAPFDGIVVTAGGPKVPESLREQLKTGGRMVIPVGSSETIQTLQRVTRLGEDEFKKEDLCGVRFVPLIGDEGWSQDHERRWADSDVMPIW